MNNTAENVARLLLQINAIKLSPAKPFTWASGWKSPIYCDNRKTLSHPEIRNSIRDAFVNSVRDRYPDIEVIAGVATGAIAIGVLVAQELNLPFCYVRPAAKSHGLGNQVEGDIEKGQRVLVIEDLISTGGSSIKAVEALKDFGCEVAGMLAIFSYGFEISEQLFRQKGLNVRTLSNYDTLLKVAEKENYISENEQIQLKMWRLNPQDWK